jgi:hypothetical protein
VRCTTSVCLLQWSVNASFEGLPIFDNWTAVDSAPRLSTPAPTSLSSETTTATGPGAVLIADGAVPGVRGTALLLAEHGAAFLAGDSVPYTISGLVAGTPMSVALLLFCLLPAIRAPCALSAACCSLCTVHVHGARVSCCCGLLLHSRLPLCVFVRVPLRFVRTACNNNGLDGGSSFAPAVIGPWVLSSPRSLAPARPVITAVSIAGRSLLGVGNEWIVVQGRQVRWVYMVFHGNAILLSECVSGGGAIRYVI